MLTFSADEDITTDNEIVAEDLEVIDSDFEMPELETEDEAIDGMKLVTENDNLQLFMHKRDESIAIVDKRTGAKWFSVPVNLTEDQVIDENSFVNAPAGTQRRTLQSLLQMQYGSPSMRKTTNLNSKADSDDTTMEEIDGGLRITYNMVVNDDADTKTTIPVEYILEDDYLAVRLKTAEIKEGDYDRLMTEVSFMRAFGAANLSDDGYFVVPDGSGALIDFNNGKANLNQYTSKVYGADITKVPTTAPAFNRSVRMPVYGIVKNGNGLMVVADKGDAQATVNAYTAGQVNKVYYNSCYFTFETRSSDRYEMSGTDPIEVYERYGIKTPEIEVRYYPVTDSNNNSEADYSDIAARYRSYLMTEKGLTVKSTVNSTPLFTDFYGGTLKTVSVAGIPTEKAYPITTFEDAQTLLTDLKGKGVDTIVGTYINFSADSIKNKISTNFDAAGNLGGNKGLQALNDYAAANNITIYPSVDNTTFKTGGGYNTIFDTAIRVSGQFSRQEVFDLAHATPSSFYKPLNLLSPNLFTKVFDQSLKGISDNGLKTAAFGGYASSLYGDYGRKTLSREMAKNLVVDGYNKIASAGTSILASDANAYVLPYVDYVSTVTLDNTGYDIFDAEIPFYQIVLHGVIPYSTTAVNGDSDIADLLMRAVASGSNLKFDMVGVPIDDLKDTRLDKYYYAHGASWTEDAADCYRFINDMIGSVSAQTIVSYDVKEDDNGKNPIITTVYSNGTEIVTDVSSRLVTVNGETHSLYDYVNREVVG
jgi:hypothetical protein